MSKDLLSIIWVFGYTMSDLLLNRLIQNSCSRQDIKIIGWAWINSLEIKGIVPTKMKIDVNYSPSCRSRPLRPLFIFGMQIEILLMKSERQQYNRHVQVKAKKGS